MYIAVFNKNLPLDICGSGCFLYGGISTLAFLILFVSPVIAIVFFFSCVNLFKKIVKGDENTLDLTGWCAIMFGFLVFSIVWSTFLAS